MELSTKIIRSQLALFKPFVIGCSLETARKGQDKIGSFIASLHKNDVLCEKIKSDKFDSLMITPKDEIVRGVALYLHGGGYTCGDIDYARGFGTTLASECGIKVFCPAYRLSPESIFPAALDDALDSFHYLISNGYKPSEIVLCGESAGGGLIYALCLKLKELNEELPCAILALSPWSDLTMSGASYETNKDIDPSMTKQRLRFYSDCYVHGSSDGIKDLEKDHIMKTNPLVSPLFGDLKGMPPSLIFVGADEVMLDDSRLLHENLLKCGSRSRLIITPDMWHAYVLYNLKENKSDYDKINLFFKSVLPYPKKLRWMRLDNAAKIYPAARNHNWSNLFRLSATLTEDADRNILQSALDVTVRRFPSISVRLRRGMFWYYLEEIPEAPKIMYENSYPLVHMPLDDIRKCAFRVLAYKNHISVEFFHALTDGNGGLIFLKTLLAEYLNQKYNADIPPTKGVLDRLEEPKADELEDSFLKNSAPISVGRGEATAYRITGTPETDSFHTNVAFTLSAKEIKDYARKYNVTVTAFITAVFMSAIVDIQKKDKKRGRRKMPIKILIPVNLRKMYGSTSLRNFVLYVTPAINPKLGEYSFEEICQAVYYFMKSEITPKQMGMKIAANVNSEKAFILKIMPLFIKNIAMKAVFNMIGERKSCFSLSNLGVTEIPDEMKKYIEKLDFVLGVQAKSPYNCGIITYDDIMRVNIIRNIKEPLLEAAFFDNLKKLGIKAKVESNQRE